ncbi:MAG: response regulator transcription factor [Anaerolineaceae bacterium]|jgi:NarL family two-component system response regulator LiaR|nr:response regulator transcription factor [Anaerolineaceae bacterium]
MFSRKITILLVDDHEVVRQGLRAYLDAQPDFKVIGEASSGEEAVEAAMEYLPDVMLMDLVMSGMGGVEATRKVKDITPRTQIVVLTSYHQDEFIFPALQAGAISYVLKDVMMDDLADAIRKASRGEAVLHPRVAERVIREINGGKGITFNPFTELTNREMEVLRLIARGMSNCDIAEDLFISENTVKGHVSNILSKLQLADRTQAAVYAWEQGLVHRAD